MAKRRKKHVQVTSRTKPETIKPNNNIPSNDEVEKKIKEVEKLSQKKFGIWDWWQQFTTFKKIYILSEVVITLVVLGLAVYALQINRSRQAKLQEALEVAKNDLKDTTATHEVYSSMDEYCMNNDCSHQQYEDEFDMDDYISN